MSFEAGAGLCAIAVLLAHICAQAALTWLTPGGLRWGIGARDATLDESPLRGRLERALRNYLETLPAFVLALIAVRDAGVSNTLTAGGSAVYVAGRAVYLPVYALGVPLVRSIVWGISMLGIVAMIVGLLAVN